LYNLLFGISTGVFDSTPLYVKEPNGEMRPENDWTVQGNIRYISDYPSLNVIFHASGPGNPENDYNPPHNNHYSDGSIENDLPMKQIGELFNVNHFIVSQVNPHSAVFSTLHVDASVWTPPLYGVLVGLLRFLKTQFKYAYSLRIVCNVIVY
jgi:hypothetical protein